MKINRIISALLAASMLNVIPAVKAEELPTITIDLSHNMGSVTHKATGFLYGLGSADAPGTNLLLPIKAYNSAQKPVDGLQHPTGDALRSAETFKAGGGELMLIMCQDALTSWQYEKLSMNDYIHDLFNMMDKMESDENHDMFVYILFNEPDWIWYPNLHTSESVQSQFLADWKLVYTAVKERYTDIKVAGPNFSVYYNLDGSVKKSAMDAFVKFCGENDCIPEYVTWHELEDSRVNDDEFPEHLRLFRELEKQYWIDTGKISEPREINITETVSPIECSNPAKLVNWIALFEENKTPASLPYWHLAGTLNSLAATANVPNGAWWLYKWYGDMTGNTYKVTTNSEERMGSFYGLASLDEKKQSASIICGGKSGSGRVVIDNLDDTEAFKDCAKVNVKIEETNWSGFLGAADEPDAIVEGVYEVIHDKVTIDISDMGELSAYRITVTPADDDADAAAYLFDKVMHFEAEETERTGNTYAADAGASNVIASGQKVSMWGEENGININVNAAKDGYYKMTVVYAHTEGIDLAEGTRNPRNITGTFKVDNGESIDIVYPNTLVAAQNGSRTNPTMEGNTSAYVYLTKGAHTIYISGGKNGTGIGIDFVNVKYYSLLGKFDRTYKPEGTEMTPGYVSEGNGTRFYVMAEDNAFYNISAKYKSDMNGKFNLYLNNDAVTHDRKIGELTVTDTYGKYTNTPEKTVFLEKGINVIDLDTTCTLSLDSIRVQGAGTASDFADNTITVQAESADGAADYITSSDYADSGSYVGGVAGNKDNPSLLTLTVNAPKAGSYKMIIYHSNGDVFGSHGYNTQLINRFASFAINDGEAVKYYFENTYSNDTFLTRSIPIMLNEGSNTIKIYNDDSDPVQGGSAWRKDDMHYVDYVDEATGYNKYGSITYEELDNKTPNFDKFVIVPYTLDEALVSDDTYKVKVKANIADSFIQSADAVAGGQNITVTVTSDDEVERITANGEDVTAQYNKAQKTLTYTVTDETEIIIKFKTVSEISKDIDIEPNKITAKLSVLNADEKSGVKYSAMLALYDSNGTLVKLAGQDGESMLNTVQRLDLTVYTSGLEYDKTKTKLFVWKNEIEPVGAYDPLISESDLEVRSNITADKTAQWKAMELDYDQSAYDGYINGYGDNSTGEYMGFTLPQGVTADKIKEAEIVITTITAPTLWNNTSPRAYLYEAAYGELTNGQYYTGNDAPAYAETALKTFTLPSAVGESRIDMTDFIKSAVTNGANSAAFKLDVNGENVSGWSIGTLTNGSAAPMLVIKYND